MFQPTESGMYEADFGTNVVKIRYGKKRVVLTGRCFIQSSGYGRTLLSCERYHHIYWFNYSVVKENAAHINALIVKQFELDGVEYQKVAKELSKIETFSETGLKINVSTD